MIALPGTDTTDSWPEVDASTLVVYTHTHGNSTLIAHAVSACFREAVPWRTLIISGVVVGLAVLPLPLVNFGNYQGQYNWIAPVHLKSMAKIVPFLCAVPFFQKQASPIVLTPASISLGCIAPLN